MGNGLSDGVDIVSASGEAMRLSRRGSWGDRKSIVRESWGQSKATRQQGHWAYWELGLYKRPKVLGQ